MKKIEDLHRKILLELNKKELQSGLQLAETCGVSVKTIRREIDEINYEVASFGCEISSKKARGYYIRVNDREKYVELLTLLSDEERRSVSLQYDNYIYRLVWLFLNSQEVIRIDDLTKYFNCSKSTIQKYLKQARELLSKYRLSIISKPNYGLYIEGDEWNIRLCMIDQFSKIVDDPFFVQNKIRGVYSTYNQGWDGNDDYGAVVRSVFNYHLKDYKNSSIPFYYLKKLYYYVKVAYCRQDKVEGLYYIKNIRDVNNSNTRKVSSRIFEDLDIAFNKKTDEADITALTVLMSSYRTRINTAERPSRSSIYIDTVKTCLEETNKRFGRVTITDELVYEICRFLWACEYRRDYGLVFDEESVYPVVRDALAVGDFCYDLGRELRKMGISVSDKESIQMYFVVLNAFNSYRRQEMRQRILLCSRYGRSYALTIANRIMNRYRKFVGTYVVCEYNDVNKDMIGNYDVIVTDIRNIFEREYDLPVVYTDFFRTYEKNPVLNDYFSYIQKEAIRKQLNLSHYHRGINVKNELETYKYIYSLYSDRGISWEEFLEELNRKNDFLNFNRQNGAAIICGSFEKFTDTVIDFITPKKPFSFNGKTVCCIVFYNRGLDCDKNIINDIFVKSVIVNTVNENRHLYENGYEELFNHVDLSY